MSLVKADTYGNKTQLSSYSTINTYISDIKFLSKYAFANQLGYTHITMSIGLSLPVMETSRKRPVRQLRQIQL